MIKRESLLKFTVFLLVMWAYIFFSIGTKLTKFSIPLLIVILINLILSGNRLIRLNLTTYLNLLFICFVSSTLFSVLKHGSIYNSFRFCIYYIYGFCIFILLSNTGAWEEKAQKYFIFFSFVYAFFTIFSVVNSETYLKLIKALFNERQYIVISWLIKTNGYPGLAGQTGNNAFMMSIGFAILFCKIRYGGKNKKIEALLLLIIGIALLLTGKRSFLFINPLCICLLIYSDNRKKILYTIIILLIVAIVTGLALFFVSNSESIINFLENNSSGRFKLYKEALRQFQLTLISPVFGNGIQSFILLSDVRGSGGEILETHNIYLQLLCETGIFGLSFFLSIIYCNFIQVVKARKALGQMDNEYQVLLSVSLYIQLIFVLYGMFGNPINDMNMLFIYFIFSALPYSLGQKYKAYKNLVGGKG